MRVDQLLASDAIAGEHPDVARDKSVLVRLTPEQHATWSAAAAAAKRTLADWVRVVVDEQLEKPPAVPAFTKRDWDLVRKSGRLRQDGTVALKPTKRRR